MTLFEELGITQEETMFLKIIGLLSARIASSFSVEHLFLAPGLSEKGQLLLIQARERYSIWLGELIKERDTTAARSQVLSRVRDILGVVPLIKVLIYLVN